jgi:hypothetical protein
MRLSRAMLIFHLQTTWEQVTGESSFPKNRLIVSIAIYCQYPQLNGRFLALLLTGYVLIEAKNRECAYASDITDSFTITLTSRTIHHDYLGTRWQRRFIPTCICRQSSNEDALYLY